MAVPNELTNSVTAREGTGQCSRVAGVTFDEFGSGKVRSLNLGADRGRDLVTPFAPAGLSRPNSDRKCCQAVFSSNYP